MRRLAFLGVILLGMVGITAAQSLYVARYIPGNFRFDNLHRIEILNNTAKPVSLAGFMLVTRDYSLRLPANATVQPFSLYRVGKRREVGAPPLDLELAGYGDFLIRIFARKVEGNYFALFDRGGRMVDAFYFSQLTNVPFLPDTGTLITANRQYLSFRVPPESSPVWKYYGVGEDPAIGFVQVEGQWRPTSSNPKRSVLQATEFDQLNGRYREGIVALNFSTKYEDNVRSIQVQRAQVDVNGPTEFATIGTLAAAGISRLPRSYTYFDPTTQKGLTYYYRLRHVDVFGQEVLSKVAEVPAIQVKVEFWMEVVPAVGNQAPGVRFYSAYSQRVKIKLLDAAHREVALLYDNLAYADVQQLLRLNRQLPQGHYTLLASTDGQRYAQPFDLRP
jgi:hypothetical protein